MVEIRHIKAFLAVAAELHFGRAASQLNIAQPALSRTIQNLEAILGVQLLERSTRSVQLTPAGRLLRDHFVKLMRQMDEALQATRRAGMGDSGTIAVGYDDAALCGPMPEVIRRFRKRCPAVKLDLSQAPAETIVHLLTERRIDCGFVSGPVRDPRLDARCIHSEAPVVVLPVSHRLSLKSRIELHDLVRERFVMFGNEAWEGLRHLCVKAGFIPELHQEVPHLDALLAFVAAEVGVSLCPAGVAKYGRSGVAIRPLVNTPLTFELHCAWHKDNASPGLAHLTALVVAASASGSPGLARGTG